MELVLKKLESMLPDVQFKPDNAFSWSPKRRTVTYKQDNQPRAENTWALIHEAAHALLGHTNYHKDVDLLMLEVHAWDKAKDIAASLQVTIDETHIQDCLDTYRDWLHQRSTCPKCQTVSLQGHDQRYACHNCHATWQVSTARFCRPYRLQDIANH